MAVATSAKTNGTGFGTGASTPATNSVATTGSISIANGETILVFGATSLNTSLGTALTISDTSSLSWTEVVSGGWTFDPGTNPRERVTAWWFRNTTGSTINTTITVTGPTGASTDTGACVIGITGNSTSFTNFVSATNTAGDPAPSLGTSPASTSAVVGCTIISGIAAAPTLPTGFTELQHFNPSGGARSREVQTIHDDTSPAQSASWTTAGTNSIAVLIEVPITSAVTGSSAGTSAVSGAGKARAKGPGSSAGAATASGAAKALVKSAGSSAGIATASGVGKASGRAAGSSTAAATASGAGSALTKGAGSATGGGTASGAGKLTAVSVASTAGTSSASGVSNSWGLASGTASGSSTADGTGSGGLTAIGSSSGSATAEGAGNIYSAGVGLSAGFGVAVGDGSSIALAIGDSSGSSTADGVGAGGAIIPVPSRLTTHSSADPRTASSSILTTYASRKTGTGE